MKKLIALVSLLSFPAFAGDTLLGTITGTAGPTTKDNVNTAVPFVIPSMSKISIQCDAASYIATNVVNGATSSNGVKVQADQLFMTSVGERKSSITGTPTAVISVIGVTAGTNCKVFSRRGDE